MAQEKNIFTKEGFSNLKRELEKLQDVTRLEIASRLNEAKEYGDLSENAAYHSAIEQRDLNEAKIAELQDMLANAEIVKPDSHNKDGVISMGDHIEIEDELGNKLEFDIVGAGETDIINKKFDVSSPLISAIAGKKKGDVVNVNLPSGKKVYKILSVK